MRIFIAAIAALFIAATANAQITHLATFENLPSDSDQGHSFTDPLSGIFFHNSTNPPSPGEFDVNYSSTFFGGGNFLSSGGSNSDSLGGNFSFTADLPNPTDKVSIDVIYILGPRSAVTLQALSSTGSILNQEAGPSGSSNDPFTLTVNTAGYDIYALKLVAGTGAAGYDNIAYTVLPEPSLVPLFIAVGILATTHPRKIMAIRFT